MNVRTALISSALLLAVVGWACEQQGPTSPSALATGAQGQVTTLTAVGAGDSGIQQGRKPCEPNDSNPKCRDSRQLYNVTVTGTDIYGGPGVTRAVRGDLIRVMPS